MMKKGKSAGEKNRLRFNELAGKVPDMLREFYRAVMAGGGVSLENYGGDYQLPKGLLWVALLSAAEQWKPHCKDTQAVVKKAQLCAYPDYTRTRKAKVTA